MKTLAELNSKWYWRLVKVIWVTLILFSTSFIVIGTGIYFYESNQGYYPTNIIDVSLKIDEYKENLSDTKRFNEIYSGMKELGPRLVENIEEKDDDGFVFRAYDQITRRKLKEHSKEINKLFGTGDTLNSIYLLRSLGYNIEGVNFTDKEKDKYIYPKDATFDKYIDGLEITINDTFGMFDKADFPDSINKLTKLVDDSTIALDNIKKGNSHRFYLYEYQNESDELNKLLGARDYVSMLGWINTILYEIGIIIAVILGTFISTYVLRGILYYIILGKFNPEK